MAAALRPGRLSGSKFWESLEAGTDSGTPSARPTNRHPKKRASDQPALFQLEMGRRLELNGPRLGESGPLERVGCGNDGGSALTCCCNDPTRTVLMIVVESVCRFVGCRCRRVRETGHSLISDLQQTLREDSQNQDARHTRHENHSGGQ